MLSKAYKILVKYCRLNAEIGGGKLHESCYSFGFFDHTLVSFVE